MNITFRLAELPDEAPMELLLLADPSRALVEAYLREGSCFLACAGSEVVGEFVLIDTAPAVMEIVNAAVRPDMQGKGIGKLLIERAIEEAKRRGAAHIDIGTGNSSLHQLKLYQRCGFRIVGIDRDFFLRHYDEEIVEDGIPCRDMIRLRMDCR